MNEFVLTATLTRLLREPRTEIDWKTVGLLSQLSPSVCEKRFTQMEEHFRDAKQALDDEERKQKNEAYTVKPVIERSERLLHSIRVDNEVLIHVFDEAKNSHQDFTCPRDLLIREVAYFESVLQNASRDSPNNDVDISVHCDLSVFDWLMRFVKSRKRHDSVNVSDTHASKKNESVEAEPQLDRSNVVSILIASEYLKMASLVEICLRFFRDNLESLVASQTNLSCINDGLLMRIAKLLTHNEIDDLKDKRDKLRSKLFLKRIELLFRPSGTSEDSPENAVTLFQCSLCRQLLTRNLECKLPCVSERMLIDEHGALRFLHEPDATFNVLNYLAELKVELKTWRDVYFKLWSTINYLRCVKCTRYFTLGELGECRYHRDDAGVVAHELRQSGTYSCCGREIVRFDLFLTANGCAMCDHIPLKTQTDRHVVEKMWTDLQRRRDLICFPAASSQFQKLSMRVGSRNGSNCVLEQQNTLIDEYVRHELHSDARVGVDLAKAADVTPEDFSREVSALSISEGSLSLGGEGKEKEKDTKGARKGVNKSVWDTSRSQRANQDFQRQDDTRRLRKLIQDLTNCRVKKDTVASATKGDKTTVAGGRIIKEFSGGLYARVEAQWRHRYASSQVQTASATDRGSFQSMNSSLGASALQRASTAANMNTTLTRAKMKPSAVISPKEN